MERSSPKSVTKICLCLEAFEENANIVGSINIVAAHCIGAFARIQSAVFLTEPLEVEWLTTENHGGKNCLKRVF